MEIIAALPPESRYWRRNIRRRGVFHIEWDGIGTAQLVTDVLATAGGLMPTAGDVW